MPSSWLLKTIVTVAPAGTVMVLVSNAMLSAAMFTVTAPPAVVVAVGVGVMFPAWPPTGGMAAGVTFSVAAGVTFSVAPGVTFIVGVGPAPVGATTFQILPVLVVLSGPPTSFVRT